MNCAAIDRDAFDVVLCLSVTKWIHIVHGDRGILELFKRCNMSLRTGGLLVIEPQEWAAYKKKRLLSPEERQKIGGIEIRPESFGRVLETMGFQCVALMRPPSTVLKGFRRPILAYRKVASIERLGDNACGSVSKRSRSAYEQSK